MLFCRFSLTFSLTSELHDVRISFCTWHDIMSVQSKPLIQAGMSQIPVHMPVYMNTGMLQAHFTRKEALHKLEMPHK